MNLDSEQLSRIFAPEVWMLVFHQFIKKDEFKEIEDSINSSPHFRKLLETKRTTLLFPKVFETLGINYENQPSSAYYEELNVSPSSSEQQSDDDEHAFPQEERPKNNTKHTHNPNDEPAENASVLKMRLVCQTWCKGVDQFYQKLPYHYKMNHDFNRDDSSESDSDSSDSDDNGMYYRDYTDYSKFEGWDRTWSMQQFICKEYRNTLRFLNHFESTHSSSDDSRNPFIGRAITIRELSYYSGDLSYYNRASTPEDREFWNAITSILEKYGHHIWYCILSARNKFSSLVEYYQTIRNWLSLMPNLKVLEINYSSKMLGSVNPSVRELQQLKNETRNNPMLKLKYLRGLKTYKIPAPLFNELVNQSSEQLNILQVSKSKVHNGYDLYSDSVSFPMLNQLSIQICSKPELNLLSKSLHNLALETLYLDYTKTAEFIEWSKVFTVIEQKFGDKITNLMIRMPIAKTANQKKKLLGEAISCRLNMPLVKRLKIDISNQVPIDFILPMTSNLEILEVYFGYKTYNIKGKTDNLSKVTNQTIQFVGFENSWMSSNIWELFPKLKRIYIDTNGDSESNCINWMGTREKWEKNRKCLNT